MDETSQDDNFGKISPTLQDEQKLKFEHVLQKFMITNMIPNYLFETETFNELCQTLLNIGFESRNNKHYTAPPKFNELMPQLTTDFNGFKLNKSGKHSIKTMEYFNFSHLPLLVKEMIADEIVHNSIPEDRIQFATTCKAFNQLVKGAKPKKIIHCIRLNAYFTGVGIFTNSGNERFMTFTEFEKILKQCQVENLSLYATTSFFFFEDRYSELLDMLTEPCRFVTALSIRVDYPEFKYVDFYKKLRHLKSFKINYLSGKIMDLPYFPPKLELQSEYPLLLLAEKTLNHPLSFLKIAEDVTLTDMQKFLMRANLEIGAEIRFYCENESKPFKGFLTFIGNGLFEFQILHKSEYLILDQEMNSQNKKILELFTDFYLDDERIPFTVTSVSNPDDVVCSGEFTNESLETIISENVDECFKVLSPYSTHYSSQLLDDWFPRTENYDPFERVKTINKTLGTNIVIIKPEILVERTQHFKNFKYKTLNAAVEEYCSRVTEDS